MATRRKNVTPGHVIETTPETAREKENNEDGGVYELDMASEAKKDVSDNDSLKNESTNLSDESYGEFTKIVLKQGATYRLRGVIYKKDTPVLVDTKVAERLLSTGFFERG